MSPERRSVLIAVVGGMMAAAYLHTEGILDLGFGFPPGGIVEGALMAATGGAAGFAVLFVYRKLRGPVRRDDED